MKITPKNILKIFLAIIVVILQDIRINLFTYIPLFFLKWPAYINIIVVILSFLSTIEWKNSRFDKFFRVMWVIHIPLNIIIWVFALISFINGAIHCNAIVFYILLGLNVYSVITKIGKMVFGKEKETNTKQTQGEI